MSNKSHYISHHIRTTVLYTLFNNKQDFILRSHHIVKTIKSQDKSVFIRLIYTNKLSFIKGFLLQKPGSEVVNKDKKNIKKNKKKSVFLLTLYVFVRIL